MSFESIHTKEGVEIYRVATAIFVLKLLSRGLKVRTTKLKDIKALYDLQGKTAIECLAEMQSKFLNKN